jgi:two-component system, NarL family, response regulator NreC
VKKIRVVIADDHAMVRAGLRALLASQRDIEVVGEADDGATVITRCEKTSPDVVVMDISMPGRGGISATEELCRGNLGAKVLVLTMYDDAAYVQMARLAGASGYVLKRSLATELVEAIRKVSAGGTHFPAGVAEAVDSGPRPPPHPLELLTDREREVLGLIVLGHTNGEIAEKLHISEKTAEAHRAHIGQKLGLRTRAGMVRFAIAHGLMPT